jgi:nucleotide-binding universal stress UspA family protein
MSTPKAVVVGVDGSWQRAGAVEWALDESLRSGPPIHVVHVVDDTYTKRPDETPHGRLTGMLLGSVARGVLQHASCPVAVVHDPRRTTQP